MGANDFYVPEPIEHWVTRPLEDRLFIMANFMSMFDRRRREYKRIGWVYAMRNSAIKHDVFKVGLSSRFPYERARELTRETGVYGEFQPVYFVHVGDRAAAEADVHRMLAEHRVSNSKEFFSASLGSVLAALDAVSGRYPVWAGPKRNPKPLAQPFLLHPHECPGCGEKMSVRELLIPVRAKCRRCGRAF